MLRTVILEINLSNFLEYPFILLCFLLTGSHLIQEIREYDWFNLLASGSCTERYQYRIRSNHNGSKVTCNHVETL